MKGRPRCGRLETKRSFPRGHKINMSPELLARRITDALRQAGFQGLLVGGCVRDLLLRREPKDWDVATDATPEDVLRLFPGSNLVGAAFGVVLVREER